MSSTPAEAVAEGDLDELVRWVDRLCAQRSWDDLVELRDRCRQAFHQTGRQLWPAASLAEYRLALDGPAAYAASVLVEGTGHLALGPLPEVAASTHTWRELGPHVVPGPPAWLAAHERVARGEDVDDPRVGPVIDLPLWRAAWEPCYLAPTYKADEVEPADPVPLPMTRTALPLPHEVIVDAGADALSGLCDHWKVLSNGSVRAVAVDGTAEVAVASLGHTEVEAVDVDATVAVQHMAWAAAGGGAHGRRRGLAVGRFEALWVVATLAGAVDDWPVDLDELGERAAELHWWAWRPLTGDPSGWSLHLAVQDSRATRAWALAATDHVS